MVNSCGVFACGKRADRNSHLSYYRLPTIRLTPATGTDPTAVGGTAACLLNISLMYQRFFFLYVIDENKHSVLHKLIHHHHVINLS